MLATDLVRPDYARAEREAARIVNEFGYVAPPVNPAEIAQGLGMKVYFVSLAGELAAISGFYDPEDNSINVNRNEPPQRQTFTIAHELGHKVLHEAWAKSIDYKVLLRDSSQQETDVFEKEANCFAANLLVPRFMLKKYSHEDVETLSKVFAVSRPMISFRLRNV